MISLVNITETFKADNVFLLKIKSNALLYKDFDFCKTYVQKDKDENETAFIGIFERVATCFCKDEADFDEIRDFLDFFGIDNVFCNEVFAKNIDKYKFSEIDLLKCKDDITGEKVYEKTFFPEYKSVYDLLSKDFSIGEYNEFVSDLSFRLKHNFARLIQCEKGVVFTAWEDENSAVISAISVYITERGNAYGSSLLKSLIYDLRQDKKQDIFVYAKEKITPFYIKNGFEMKEKIYSGKVS